MPGKARQNSSVSLEGGVSRTGKYMKSACTGVSNSLMRKKRKKSSDNVLKRPCTGNVHE